MTLGEKVKLKREELGLSQEELAEKMNYKSKTSIHKIEQDITDLPLSKVKELANVLKTSSAYLMGWEDEKDKMINEIFNTEMIDSSVLTEEISQLPFLDSWNNESSMIPNEIQFFLTNDLDNLDNAKSPEDLKSFIQHLKIAKNSYLKYIKKIEEHRIPIKYKIVGDDRLEELKEIKYKYFEKGFTQKNTYFIKSVENEKIIYFLINPNKISINQLEEYVIEYREKKYLKRLIKLKDEYAMMGINKNNEAEIINKKDFKVLGTVISKNSD